MPVTLFVQIAVIRCGDQDVRQAPPGCSIYLKEQPPEAGGGYKLYSVEGRPWYGSTGERLPEEIPITPQTSQRLAQLVEDLPAQGMTSPRMSFDGCDYHLAVIQTGGILDFTWSNEDWRFGPEDLLGAWQRVSVLANTVDSLVRDHRQNLRK